MKPNTHSHAHTHTHTHTHIDVGTNNIFYNASYEDIARNIIRNGFIIKVIEPAMFLFREF